MIFVETNYIICFEDIVSQYFNRKRSLLLNTISTKIKKKIKNTKYEKSNNRFYDFLRNYGCMSL